MYEITTEPGLESVGKYCEEVIDFSNDVFWKPFDVKMHLPCPYIIGYFVIEPKNMYLETVTCGYIPKEAYVHVYSATHVSRKIIDNLESNFSKYRLMLEFEQVASAFPIGKRDASPRFSQCIAEYTTRLKWASMNGHDSRIVSLPDIVMHSLFKCSYDGEEVLRNIGEYLFNKKLGAEHARNNLAESLNIEKETMSKLEKATRLKDIIRIASTEFKDFDKNFYKYSMKPSKPNDAASTAQFFLLENVGSSFCAKRPICSYLDSDKYLFRLKMTYPRTGKVNEKMRNAFMDEKISLSSSARISRIDEKKWKITDGTVLYRIVDTGGKLNIYFDSEQIWKFPVHLTDPKIGDLGYVGEIIVGEKTNEIIKHTSIDEMEKQAILLDKKFENYDGKRQS
ncbi:hypothetical protein BEH94_10975 [Candidatus Altiarchaeales archaeon WOR_SM1_SCG]|nr:hypothetical protein BEH94_10975 [Candidatus Altiarchaeales archaeon WOR_SM1_SCG]